MNLFRSVGLAIRHLSAGTRSGLVGRDLVDLKDLYQRDLKSLLWTALDLKIKFKSQNATQLLQGKHITLLMTSSEPFIQAVAGRAVFGLGGILTTIVDPSLQNMNQCDVEDLGRALSTNSDVILVHIEDQSLISKLADGAIVPTVAWRSEKFATLQAIADIMTICEHFKILSPRTVSWVGPPTALFNSYLYIMPRMKLNLRFCCSDADNQSKILQSVMHAGIENAIANKTEFHECLSPAEAIYRTDVIVTTGHDIPSLALNKKNVDEASLEYLILHDLPRGKFEMSQEMFRSEHSATWKSKENLTWLTMSVILNLTQDCRPSVPEPTWELE